MECIFDPIRSRRRRCVASRRLDSSWADRCTAWTKPEASPAEEAWIILCSERCFHPSPKRRALDGLARACAAVAVPVFAIGGITPGRAKAVARAGAGGVAGIGLFIPPKLG